MIEQDSQNVLAEDKILILYILEKVGKPLSYKELLELIIAVSNINYFDFQQFLSDLLEDKYITKTTNDELELYELTEEGTSSLDLTLDLIPGIIKLQIDSQFKENFDLIQDKFSISAEYNPISENEFKVTCKIIENHQNLFKTEILVSSKEQASQIVNNWNTNAANIYPKILEDLIN